MSNNQLQGEIQLLCNHLTTNLSSIATIEFKAPKINLSGSIVELICFIKPAANNVEAVAAFESMIDSFGIGLTITCFSRPRLNGVAFDSVFIERFTSHLFLATNKRSIHIEKGEFEHDDSDVRFKQITSKTRSYINAIIKETIKASNEKKINECSIDALLSADIDASAYGLKLTRVGKSDIAIIAVDTKAKAMITPELKNAGKYNLQLSGLTLTPSKMERLYELLSN